MMDALHQGKELIANIIPKDGSIVWGEGIYDD